MANQSQEALALQDRVAIVTGASRGIGNAIALHLSSLGAKLVVNFTSPSSKQHADNLVNQINTTSSSVRAVAVQADVSDEAQVKSLFDAAEAAFGTKPHILVANAGVSDPTYSSISEIDADTFKRVIDVNLNGTFLCMKEAGKRIINGGGGRIVTVSSSLAAVYRPGTAAYTASKAAVEAMTKIMAKEMKGTGITVNCVAPGPIATEMFFEGKSEEIVKKKIEECETLIIEQIIGSKI